MVKYTGAVELEAPDISAYELGNTGVPFVTTLDSGKPGPDAMINAVIHGNEICGAIALDFLFKTGFKPTVGKLTLAFVNTAAYAKWDASDPGATRFVDEDMNRVWTPEQLDGRADASEELRRARELRPFFDRVQYLLDIHSMSSHHGALLLCAGAPKQRNLCAQIGTPGYVGCGP
jgi:predicted deacylase